MSVPDNKINLCDTGNIKFSVMTVNLRFGLADDGSNSWKYRKSSFKSLFNSYQPDFIGMQEANDFQTDYLQQILIDYQYIGKRTPAPEFWQNNILFYKHPWKCVFSERFFLSHVPSIPSRLQGSKWPRQCTIGIFQAEQKSIICVNTHFDFDPMIQVKTAEIIIKKLSSLPSGIPVIILGDFNSEPGSFCHKLFISNSTGNENFKDIFQNKFPGTFHGFTGQSGRNHIDWILYRGQKSLKNKEIINRKFNNFFPSDHFPVYASFFFNPEIKENDL